MDGRVEEGRLGEPDPESAEIDLILATHLHRFVQMVQRVCLARGRGHESALRIASQHLHRVPGVGDVGMREGEVVERPPAEQFLERREQDIWPDAGESVSQRSVRSPVSRYAFCGT